MSDKEDSQTRYKKRRLKNSCDECRRRKIKCDSSIMPGNVCSNCIAFKAICTHEFVMAKRVSRPTERFRTRRFLYAFRTRMFPEGCLYSDLHDS
ncbi:hypothetical protein GYMLUDRAFT_955869 [Collybiopsis luxurians FD-317 M1]|nr:hypothetical protein GYMLUDRAFT_955869 [Collybiopsis luxurians FD-317 M1]